MRDRLPHLKAIVQYKGKLSQAYENVYDVSELMTHQRILLIIPHLFDVQWQQFMALGKDMEDSVIEDKIKAQKPEQCALLIYTVS